ncbi:MAG: T9SS type A sorting domain-containing protein [Candidatus Cloacimonetes bacterium]|nr:T9SS type A sorting domain-containing protein [Candidatus Cloacimonadota bacterium]
MTVEEYTGGLPMMETWTLFGDAALQVRTDPPSLLTLSNEVVLMGVDFTTIITANGSPIEGVLVSLYQDGVAYTGFTDETGYVSISHSLIAGDAKMTVTGFNTETIYNDITVIPPDGAYVIYNSYNLDDSSGNNNGLLDYGETVNIDMSVNNVGNLQATNVIVTITTSDTYVTIIDSTENYGNIPANTIVNIEDAFSFEVANNVPDEHGILFTLEATDGIDTWISNFLITAHAPLLEFVGFYIDDTASGNGDYMWDPGETVDIIVTLINNGSSNAFNVMGELITIDPFVTLNTTGAQPYGDLTFGNTAEQSFNATSDINTPDAHLASFNINITADLGITGSGSFEVQIGGYLIEEYFNSWLPDGWTTTGGTNWGSGSGNYGGGTPPEAEFDWYPSTTATQRLISLPVNTTGSATLELEFKHSVNHYNGTYELRVETTSDGGNTWNVVQTWPAQNLPATTENLIIDNDDVGSSTFQVAWVFDGYSWNINYWYVDDVILGGGAVPCGYIEGMVTLVGGTGNVEDVIVNAGGITTNPDASGEYTLEVVPGTYDVTAELAGYISQTISGVEVFEDLTTSGIDFTLDVAVPPSNLVATVVTYNDVHLEWDQPVTFLGDTSVPTKAHREKLITANIRKQAEITDKTRDLLGYKIYRDGELIYEITDPSVTTYDDLALDAGEYEYGVTAVYEGGSSIPCPGIVTITLPAPINPVATSIPPDILVEWDAPPIPTRDLSHYKVYRDMVMIADNITDLFYIDTNVPPNSYIYNITAVYDGGWESDFSEDAEVSVVGTDNILIPIRTELTGNYPNPFNPTTTISFSLKEADNVRIDIYNLKGEKVKTLIDNYMEAAYHTVEWNGKDNNDRSVASGIYLYRMCLHPDLSGKAGARYTSTKKMILLK